jgi:hypothetical protein
MAHTRTWDAAYELTPPNPQSVSQGAQRIRELKVDIRERLDLDHIMDDDDTNDGRHRVVTLIEQASDPGNLANTHLIYTKDVGGVTEIFYQSDSGNIQQITNNGKIQLLNNNNAFTKGQATTEVIITFASTITPNASLSNAFVVTLTGNITVNTPSNGKSGQVITLRFKQDGTGGRTLTFGSGWRGNAGDDLALSTGASDLDVLIAYFTGSVWHVLNLKKDVDNAL